MTSKKHDPSFVDMYRPRHFHVEAMESAMQGNPVPLTFCGVADTTRTRPKTLLELYMPHGIAEIEQDARIRPDHYSPRQHALIDHIQHKAALDQPVTDTDKNELLLTWLRDTRVEQVHRESVKRVTTEEIDLDTPTFENQDFEDKIIV